MTLANENNANDPIFFGALRSNIDHRKVKRKNRAARSLIVTAIGTILAIKIYLMIFVIDPFVGAYGVITTSLVFVAFLFAFAKYKSPSFANAYRHRIRQPPVTVIIPAKNEPVLIRESARSILDSTYKNSNIILVNDGSTDETGKVMDEIARENPCRIEVLHLTSNMGKRRAIREAIAKKKPDGEIIILMDSDTVVDRFSVERLVSALDNPDVGAATGHTLALNADKNALTKIQETWYDGQYYVMKGMESSFQSVTCCPGTFSAYRKEAMIPCLEEWCNDKFLGVEFKPGDDRQLTAYVLGGTKHYIDRNSKAWKAVYCEDALAYTEVPAGFRKFINQQIRWKKSWVRTFLFAAPFFYKNRGIVPTLWYYTQMALSMLTPFIAFRALVLMPMQGRINDALFYLLGLAFVGFMFALTYRIRHPESGDKWIYRVLMAPIGVLMGFLLYYAMFSIRKSSWLTR